MKRTNLFIPEQFLKALHGLAKRTGVKFSEHIRRAIEAYLKLQDKGKPK